ncbi:unnamed protein product [Callosobruchus maculatus]|uniref:Uncharacterized protein n=2 Tax=Callosobruchus maculatus TaxID=64391 RepID=A0A653C0F0_CALMS|nr:unnamed protein product [Callosobruchus maculatus]
MTHSHPNRRFRSYFESRCCQGPGHDQNVSYATVHYVSSAHFSPPSKPPASRNNRQTAGRGEQSAINHQTAQTRDSNIQFVSPRRKDIFYFIVMHTYIFTLIVNSVQ